MEETEIARLSPLPLSRRSPPYIALEDGRKGPCHRFKRPPSNKKRLHEVHLCSWLLSEMVEAVKVNCLQSLPLPSTASASTSLVAATSLASESPPRTKRRRLSATPAHVQDGSLHLPSPLGPLSSNDLMRERDMLSSAVVASAWLESDLNRSHPFRRRRQPSGLPPLISSSTHNLRSSLLPHSHPPLPPNALPQQRSPQPDAQQPNVFNIRVTARAGRPSVLCQQRSRNDFQGHQSSRRSSPPSSSTASSTSSTSSSTSRITTSGRSQPSATISSTTGNRDGPTGRRARRDQVSSGKRSRRRKGKGVDGFCGRGSPDDLRLNSFLTSTSRVRQERTRREGKETSHPVSGCFRSEQDKERVSPYCDIVRTRSYCIPRGRKEVYCR
ncbi:unnamed protein product [Cyprideis torosa]|uniref:Uncharacterized protein n=1 Tax=Cyprideis torosa TaxID=163714 RepID=A0A7R8ZJX6_9CRUS|nr:unnamed protein product [Cyprideis torosa]CAG0889511.1 unnamed protein product [Cyprideis torosa]